MNNFTTIEKRINNSTILPLLKKLFEKHWGKDLVFQYIDPCWLDSEDSIFDKKLNIMRRLTNKEIIQDYLEETLDIFNDSESSENYFCEKCHKETLGKEYVLERYPRLNNNIEYKIMNYCESCQDKYLENIE